MPFVTVSGVCRKISEQTGIRISPHQISDLFYKRHLDCDRCPIVGRARVIPLDYIPAIVAKLRQRGLITEQESG